MKNISINFLITLTVITLSHVYAFPQIQFEKHLTGNLTAPLDVFTHDINGDGHLDILTVSRQNGGNVVWWENDGYQSFTSRQVASDFDNPRSVRAGDIDSDGDADIIAVAWEGDRISWWENDGEQGFTRHDVVTGWAGPHTVELLDLDQDGDMDILCSQFDMSENMSEIAWWENDGMQNWTKHTVSSRFHQSPFAYGADMDNDGDIDIIGCGELKGEVCLWKNDGQQNWTEYVIDNQFPKAHTILARDFDKDGDMDILAHACTSSLQAWYENRGDGSFVKRPMENLGGAIYMDCADFDLDGDYDLIATGMTATSLVCYENNGKQGLTRHELPGGLASGFALNVADLDRDGDMDVVAVGLNSNTLAWWENTIEKTSFMDAPKWLAHDEDQGVIFVANEEAGSIVRIEASGFQYCIRNSLPIASGLTICSGKLWLASGTTILSLNPLTGAVVSSIRTSAQFLHGLASDSQGRIFASDPFSGVILKIDAQTDGIEELAGGLEYPASIKYDHNMGKLLVLDGEEAVTIKCLDPSTGELVCVKETTILTGGDIVSDGNGNHYISSPDENAIYAATNNFEDPVYLYSEGLSSPTGLAFFRDEGSLGYLSPVLNSLEMISANASGIMFEHVPPGSLVSIYPNPATDYLSIEFPRPLNHDVSVRIRSMLGREVYSREFSGEAGIINIDLKNHNPEPGIYLVEIDGSGLKYREKVIVR